MTAAPPPPNGDPNADPKAASQFLLNFPAQPQFTFETFIESPASSFALAQAKDFCSTQDSTYTSLAISGGAGLGKTHLLLAMGNLAAQQEVNALYISCPSWIKKLDLSSPESGLEWAEQIKDVQLLLIDDIDCISGHAVAQEVLYQVYNTLRENDGRLALSSRTPPHRLLETEEYLKSRFQWGMTVNINPLNDEALKKVYTKLGQDCGLEMPTRVVNFLIRRLRTDYPSLKKAVETINKESLRQKRPVTIPFVKIALNISSDLQ